MRVTNNMIFGTAEAQIAMARERVETASQQSATGERVMAPGDDPAAASLITSHRIALARYGAIDQVISRGVDEAQVADGALQSVGTLISRARDLATQLGNDSYTAPERAAAGQEVTSISAQIVNLMNTTVAGRYIFAGTSDGSPAYDATGKYLGSSITRKVEIAPGILEDAAVRGDQVLGSAGGGVDVFATLKSLAAALGGDDGASVRNSVAALAGASDQVATSLTQIGNIQSSLQSAQSIGQVAQQSVQQVLATESEVDPFQAATELTKANQALESTLAVAAKTFNISLLNFLGGS